MIRVGIVGAENSHSGAIAKILNVDKRVPGCRVVAIWGETREFAEKSAERGRIPTIVKRPADMIGEVDGVMIDHRHARYHLPAAEPFLKAKLPMFIDKPFCYRLAAGKKFLARCRRAKVPVTSFSTIPMLRSLTAFRRQAKKAGAVRTVSMTGPCDLESPYGGIFFYGIHQVDCLIEAFGVDVAAVNVTRAPKGGEAIATLFWRSGLIGSMHCIQEGRFQISAVTAGGPVCANLDGDPVPYLSGARKFTKMFKTGTEPVDHKRILITVAVLEAMQKAVKTGRLTPVARV